MNNQESVIHKKRDPVFDIMKGIAIFFVVMSHSNVAWLSSHTFATLRSPLFFIISGYFAKEWLLMNFIRNGAKRLLIPYVVTSLFMFPFVFLLSVFFPKTTLLRLLLNRFF